MGQQLGKKTNNGTIDWKAVHSSFRSVLERDLLGERLSMLTMPLLLVLVGLLLVGFDNNNVAIGFFMAALLALLWTRRRMARCESRQPFVVTGLLTGTRKETGRKMAKGVQTLMVKVRTAHYIHARGKGEECPELIGVKRIPAPESIVQALKLQTVVSLVCLPNGEARGIINKGKMFIPDHGNMAPPQQ